MPAPTFDLPIYGGAPNQYATEGGLEAAINAALTALWNGLMRNGGKIFGSRDEAVAFGQANLPTALRRIITIEGNGLVLRAAEGQFDPLFDTLPRWGMVFPAIDTQALAADLGDGRTYHLGGAENPSGATIPASADLVITVHNASGQTRSWRAMGAPSDGLETPTWRRDAGGRWWSRVLESDLVTERTDRIAAIRDAGVMPLVNVAGTANAITATLTPAMISGGATIAGASTVEIIPAAANTGPVTLDLGEGPVSVRAGDGAELPAGALVAGRSYCLRRRTSTSRVVAGGVTATELAGEATAVVSRMWWKLPGGSLRACEAGSDQAARSSGIGWRG